MALVLLAACTTFEPISRNVCGNGLLEPGEDCDSNDARCVRCAVTCTTSADCPTSDYACGVDGECHAPGGELAQPVTAGTFEVGELRVSDLDHDGLGDVLGISTSSVVIRHGAASGLLSREDSFVTPTQLGTTAFGRLDGDGSLDLALSTVDGIVSYTSPYGTLSPLAVPTVVTGMAGAQLDLRTAFAIAPFVLGAVVVDSGDVLIGAVDFLNPNAQSGMTPCNAAIPASELALDRVDVYQVNRASDVQTDVIVALQTKSGRVCVTSIHKDNLFAAPVLTDITPTIGLTLTKKPILADLDTDSDRCPGLVDTSGGSQLRWFDGAMAGGHCVLAATSTALPPITTGALAVGRAPLDPAILGVASDTLVMSDGLYAYIPGTSSWVQMYASARTIAGAASADLDRDGDIDTVLYAQSSDDLDILYRSQNPAGYELLRYDTASEVTSVTLGDYDGNGYGDILYTEKLADHQRMLVAWGTPDRPLPPQTAGEIGAIASIARLSFADSVDTLNVCDDLAVLQPPQGTAPPTLTLFHGSPQRALLPYFDPRNSATTTLHAAAIGRFGGDYPDLLAVAPTTSTTTAVQALVVDGTSNGLEAASVQAVGVTGLADCASANGSDVCISSASYLAWPMAPDRDVVLAIDDARHAAMFDPAQAAITALPMTSLVSAIPGGSTVKALAAADVDGDGAPELIAAFAPTATGAGAVLVCAMQGGMPQGCSDLVPIITAAEAKTTACVGAAPAHLGFRDPTTAPNAASDVIVLCHDDGSTLYRVSRSGAGYRADRVFHSAGVINALAVGDVTGDGIDDISVLEGEVGSQSLVVLRQCTSRDVETCQHASEETMP